MSSFDSIIQYSCHFVKSWQDRFFVRISVAGTVLCTIMIGCNHLHPLISYRGQLFVVLYSPVLVGILSGVRGIAFEKYTTSLSVFLQNSISAIWHHPIRNSYSAKVVSHTFWLTTRTFTLLAYAGLDESSLQEEDVFIGHDFVVRKKATRSPWDAMSPVACKVNIEHCVSATAFDCCTHFC